MGASIADTYAEAFRSLYVEFLITARDRQWVEHAVHAAVGNASSTILCDCEAGLVRYVGPGGDETFSSPDGRPGAIVQLHVPRFVKNRQAALERAALVRISQNVLTCPAAACFNLIEADAAGSFPLGRKIAYFGDGFQRRIERYGRKLWWIPTLGGEFVLDRRFGFAEGVMGGNLWFLGNSVEAALDAATAAAAAIEPVEGVITPFPGGVTGSGSKAGSRYPFLIASSYEKYCPLLREVPEANSALPTGVASVMEIIINGRDQESIERATRTAIQAARDVPGLVQISAGNYGGRLGKHRIYLQPLADARSS